MANFNEISYPAGDLYPLMGIETAEKTTPSPEEQETLHGDGETANEATKGNASFKNILLAFLIAIVLIVFFGGAK